MHCRCWQCLSASGFHQPLPLPCPNAKCQHRPWAQGPVWSLLDRIGVLGITKPWEQPLNGCMKLADKFPQLPHPLGGNSEELGALLTQVPMQLSSGSLSVNQLDNTSHLVSLLSLHSHQHFLLFKGSYMCLSYLGCLFLQETKPNQDGTVYR